MRLDREVIEEFLKQADLVGVVHHYNTSRLLQHLEHMDDSELRALSPLPVDDGSGVHDPLRDAAQYAIDWFTLDIVDFTKKYRDINHMDAWLYPTPPQVARVLREALDEPVE